jgi:hypothetical protein
VLFGIIPSTNRIPGRSWFPHRILAPFANYFLQSIFAERRRAKYLIAYFPPTIIHCVFLFLVLFPIVSSSTHHQLHLFLSKELVQEGCCPYLLSLFNYHQRADKAQMSGSEGHDLNREHTGFMCVLLPDLNQPIHFSTGSCQ